MKDKTFLIQKVNTLRAKYNKKWIRQLRKTRYFSCKNYFYAKNDEFLQLICDCIKEEGDFQRALEIIAKAINFFRNYPKNKKTTALIKQNRHKNLPLLHRKNQKKPIQKGTQTKKAVEVMVRELNELRLMIKGF